MTKQSIQKCCTAILIIIAVIVVDVISKAAIIKEYSLGRHDDFLNGFIRISLVYNEGGVFGIAQGHKTLFLVISIAVLTLLIAYYIYERNKTMMFNVSIAMILSGAVGNIIDRLIPMRRGVVDFISIGDDRFFRWPSFNIADSSIVIGACLLILVFWLEERKRKKNEKQLTDN